MVTKLFWQDAYLTKLYTTVTTVDEQHITLAETIFVPATEVHCADRGTIGGYPVLRARQVGRTIVYTLPLDHQLQRGDRVIIEIDEKQRSDMRRLHFITALIDHCTMVRSGYIDETFAKLTFNGSIDVFTLQEQLATIISKDEAITHRFDDFLHEQRVWMTPSLGTVRGNGIYPRITTEVGIFQLRWHNQVQLIVELL